MTVTFYECSDDIRVLYKTMTNAKSVDNVDVYGDMSMSAPTLILSYDADIIGKNYFYVPTWGRYYRVRDIAAVPAGKLVVTGDIDALYTYADQIVQCRAQAVRASSAGFTYVPDTSYPTDPGREYVTSLELGASDLDPPGIQPANPYRYLLTLKG